MQAAAGNTRARLAIQTALTRVDVPDAWQVISGGLTVLGNDDEAATLTVSSLTAGKMWVRFGVAFSVDTTGGGTAPGSADVTLMLATIQKGMLVGSWKGQLTATTSSESPMPVGGWMPAAWAAKVYAGIVQASCGALTTFKSKLVYRTATSAQDIPGAWTNTADSGPATGGNGQRVAEDTALSLGSNMWVQFGIAYWATSGVATAEVSVSIVARIA